MCGPGILVASDCLHCSALPLWCQATVHFSLLRTGLSKRIVSLVVASCKNSDV